VLAVAVKVHEVLLTKISGEDFGDLDGKVGDMDFKSELPGNGLDMFSIAYIVEIESLSERK